MHAGVALTLVLAATEFGVPELGAPQPARSSTIAAAAVARRTCISRRYPHASRRNPKATLTWRVTAP
jgi:hypothetical protein